MHFFPPIRQVRPLTFQIPIRGAVVAFLLHTNSIPAQKHKLHCHVGDQMERIAERSFHRVPYLMFFFLEISNIAGVKTYALQNQRDTA